MTDDKRLLEVRPSMWNFFWHWLFFWLVIPPIVAIWKRAALVFRVYSDKIVLEKGVLNKNVKEIFISDVRTIDTKQNLLQRMFRIGDVMIATAGTSGYEDIAHGLPNPGGVKDLIVDQRRLGKSTGD